MANRFGTARILGDLSAEVTPQERVNLEMLRAVESLGKRLERTESERDRLAARLALIEASATIDEKTGKLYLPVVVDPKTPLPQAQVPLWAVGTSVFSSVLALFALGLSLWHTPEGPQLTPRQLAALNALAGPMQMADAKLSNSWKKVDEVEGVAPAAAKTAEPVRSAALPTHMYHATFGPEQPPVAEASEGWSLAGTSTETPVVKSAPALIEEAEGPAPTVTGPVSSGARLAPVEKAEAPAQKPVVAEAPKAAPAPKPTVTAEAVEPSEEPAEEKTAQAEDKPIALTPAPEKLAEQKPAEKSTGIDINPDPALSQQLQELERKAFAGSPEAQHDLATLYAAGKSVTQDYKRAAYWFYKAADGGIANADYNLGVMFQQGMGVKKDVNKALGWYEKAAQLGHPEAMYNLGIAYVEGVGTTRNIDRGVSYFKKAANAGVAQAAYNLGVLYESNFVGPINLAKAAEWYQVAADEGHASAKDAVARLKQQIAVASKTGDQGAKVAASVEPASGIKEDEEMGEGDASPLDAKLALLVKTQEALIAHGDLSGKPSGLLDEKTMQVIRSWQNRLGLEITGQPTQELLDDIKAKNAK
jgi:TPR repeat protein